MDAQVVVVCENSVLRGGTRVEVDRLVCVDVPGQPAFLLNLSEGGMAIQAMEVLQPQATLEFAFALPESHGQLQGRARIVWADKSGRAGLEFTEISEYDRFQLKRWLLETQAQSPR